MLIIFRLLFIILFLFPSLAFSAQGYKTKFNSQTGKQDFIIDVSDIEAGDVTATGTVSGATVIQAGVQVNPASDTVYGASWDAVTTIAPSKNAVYDKIEASSGDITTVGDCTSGNTFTFKGLTSGTTALKPTAIAGTTTITLPAETGTACTTGSVCSGYQASITNYVGTVADGTGIDGTASGAGSTYTPSLDLTEINSFTFGSGTFTTAVFDAGAADPTFTFGSNIIAITNAATFTNGGNAVSDAATSFGGDVTGTIVATIVGDDSHAHTTTTISGIDISADTNLAVTAPIVLTDDTLSLTVAKDIVAGVGLSGGEDNILPGADADTTLTLDLTEIASLTWGSGTFTAMTFDAGVTDPVITASSGDLAVSTGTFTLLNTGLHLLDTNASHDLIIKPGSDLTADKTLTLA